MPSSKLTKQPTSNKTQQKRKPEVQHKPYVFNVAPNMIKANKPKVKKSVNNAEDTTPKFTAKAGLVQCKNCTRNFASDLIETHRIICKKTAKKRKPFDVSKARVEGTDAANFICKTKGTRKQKVGQIIFVNHFIGPTIYCTNDSFLTYCIPIFPSHPSLSLPSPS